MKRLFILWFACVAVLSISANPVSKENARKLAAKFMQEKGLQLGGEAARARGNKTATDNQSLYVFNTVGNHGFIIVAGDDRAEPILGYTTQGSFDENDLPENFRYWLEQTSAEIESLPSLPEGCVAEANPVPTHPAIGPLITTHWDQGNNDNVYNALLPKVDGQLPCTGCVATAGAQIMYYYKWPQAPTQDVPHYQLVDKDGNDVSHGANTSNDLPSITFQWDKMDLQYSKRNETDALKDSEKAVAELMLYCGYAAHMNYGLSEAHGGSSSSAVTLAGGMGQFFDYDPTTWRDVFRLSYTVAEWDALMYNELALGRPIIYSGSYSGGHSFVCDGYDGAGLFHFNWGWGGDYDGYFKLQATNPYGSVEYWNMGFINEQHAIIGLHPNNAQWASGSLDENIAVVSDVRVNNTAVSMKFYNRDNETKGFGFGIGELKGDGSVVAVDTKYEHYKNSNLPSGYYYFFNFDFSGYNLSEGTHRLVPICILNGETAWKQCRPSDVYFEVKVSGGEKTVTAHPTISLEAKEFDFPTGIKSNQVVRLDLTVSNKGDEYKQPLYLFTSQTESKQVVYVTGSAIEKGGSEVVTFYFVPRNSGDWNIWVATDYYGNDIIGTTTINVPESMPAKLEITSQVQNLSGNVVKAENYVVKVEVTNVGEYAYDDIIEARLYKQIPGTNSGTQVDEKTYDLQLEPNAKASFNFTFDDLEDGSNYFCFIYYYSRENSATRIYQASGGYSYKFEYTPGIGEKKPGDANGDGTVDANDVKTMLDYMLGVGSIDSDNADLNSDGKVTIADVIKLVNELLK